MTGYKVMIKKGQGINRYIVVSRAKWTQSKQLDAAIREIQHGTIRKIAKEGTEACFAHAKNSPCKMLSLYGKSLYPIL